MIDYIVGAVTTLISIAVGHFIASRDNKEINDSSKKTINNLKFKSIKKEKKKPPKIETEEDKKKNTFYE